MHICRVLRAQVSRGDDVRASKVPQTTPDNTTEVHTCSCSDAAELCLLRAWTPCGERWLLEKSLELSPVVAKFVLEDDALLQ